MLEGKHAVITGGGTGIGLSIAQALAGAGAEVTITGRRAEVLEAVAGPGLHPLVMDVTEESSVTRGVAQAVAARRAAKPAAARISGPGGVAQLTLSPRPSALKI